MVSPPDCQKLLYRDVISSEGKSLAGSVTLRSENAVDRLYLDREDNCQRGANWAPRPHARGSMRFKNMGALAALAVGVGFSGFMSTGCGDLAVGPTLQAPDSVPKPGFDDPDAAGNIVPIEESRIEPENLAR
jgi:hypothetical protein